MLNSRINCAINLKLKTMRTISKRILVWLLPLSLNAQSPANDLHWNTGSPKFQDDFNSMWPNWSVIDHNGWIGHGGGTFEFDQINSKIINYTNGTAWPNNVLELSSTFYNTTPICPNNNAFITTGYVNTGAGNTMRYGYYEARVDFGQAVGNTYMPAFWLQMSGAN